jgi:hypothetical protein
VSNPQGGRPEGGTRAAARELGVNREEARRAVRIASIAPQAREAAREAGLDDNQSALLRIASAAPETQVLVVAGIVEARAAPRQKTPTIVLDASEYTVETETTVATAPPRLPRIKNTIAVPERVEGETAEQKTARLFLHFASDDLEVCNKIVCELGVQRVESQDSLDRMLNAAQDVIVAWEKVKLEVAKRYHSRTAAPEPVEIASAPVEVKTPAPTRLDVAALIKPLLSAAPVEVEVVAAVDPVPESVEVVAEPGATCAMEDCEGGNRWETVEGVRQDMGRCGLCNPEPVPAAEVSEPTVIKPRGNKLSKHGAVTRLTVDQYEARKLAEERADRRRAAKEAQRMAA